MRKIILVVGSLLLLSILTVTASAIVPIPLSANDNDDAVFVPLSEISDVTLLDINYGPGSEVPWYDPIVDSGDGYTQGIWLSNVEPDTVTWTYSDPMWHEIYRDTHAPSVKQEGAFQSGGKVFKWAYADYTTFTIPAFPKMGNWYATPTFTLMNGQSHNGAFNYYIPINNPGSPLDNIFSAPVYFFGFKLPAIFWLMGLVWIPGLVVLLLVVWGRGIVGAVKIFKQARDAARRARSEWRKGKGK